MDNWEAKYVPTVVKTLLDAGADDLAVQLAFCTIRVESDWHNYTNIRVPDSFNYPNDGRPPSYESERTQLSVGLYQQQVQFWGGTARCMDPVRATLSWYQGIPEIGTPGLLKFDYHNMSAWNACQAVQGSQFSDGGNYKVKWPDALRLFSEISLPAQPQTYWKGFTMSDRFPSPDSLYDALQPFYKVVRDNATKHDYAYAPGIFIHISSEDEYFFYRYGGFINEEHGSAREVNRNWLEFAQKAAQDTGAIRVDGIA